MWVLLLVIAFFVAVMAGLAWLGVRVRRQRRGAVDGFLGPFEDMWHPAAHRARFEARTVEERVVPLPSPDKP
jgi:hypothetical protein